MRKTKIVCTIGPASDSEKMLAELIDAGMNVARLNFSHGNHDEHGKVIERIRKISQQKNTSVAILQDLAGPKIRVGQFKSGSTTLKTGDEFILTAEPDIGEPNKISVTYSRLPQELHAKDQVLLADGSIELRVKEIKNDDVICEVIVGGELSSNKGINLPERSLAIAALTEKDRIDLKFGLEQGVDYIAMSFVRRADDISEIKKIMAAQKKYAPVIAKIEKHEALENIDDILKVVDGIMVARGDLAVETSLEKVPIAQKMLIKKCNQAYKPVITATQMLKSMVESPRPTRAEANDVANAVLDGTDAVMLSEETTIGAYPVKAVQVMAKIAQAAEESDLVQPHQLWPIVGQKPKIEQAISHAAFQMAKDLDAAAILTPTQSGSTAKMVSSYRPKQPVIAFSPDERVVRQLSLVWGVCPFYSGGYYNTVEMFEKVKDTALNAGLVKFGDTVVLTAGLSIGVPGTTNLLKAEVLK